MRIYLAYIPPKEIDNYFKGVVKNLAGSSGYESLLTNLDRELHITLKCPFDIKDTSRLETRLEEFTESHRATPFILDGLGHFESTRDYYFYSRVRRYNEMKEVFDKFIDSLLGIEEIRWSKFDGKKKELHLTFATTETKVRFDRVAKLLAEIKIPRFQLVFDNISLIKRGEILRRFDFSKT